MYISRSVCNEDNVIDDSAETIRERCASARFRTKRSFFNVKKMFSSSIQTEIKSGGYQKVSKSANEFAHKMRHTVSAKSHG